ncbi:MAG TPA: SDR family oxidoreductase [Gammaproteobacteria bacterium]|nr:SDR family oxidoreductase [Gammaproteobacteria bacterium]
MIRCRVFAIVGAVLVGGMAVTQGAVAETVLITGANSGLGLEFVKQYAAKGWTVIATHRRHDMPETLAPLVAKYPNVRVEHMDVSSIEDVKASAAKLKGVPIDVLINNAGVYSDRSHCTTETCTGAGDTQTFGNIDYALFDTIMATNVRGPLIVSESLIDNVRASRKKMIVAISSTNGSLSKPLPGPQGIAYRSSKSALNRAMQLVAVKEKDEGVTVLMLHPGTVVTERLESNRGQPNTVDMEPSVAGMIKIIDKATIKDTGRFLQYDGTTAPW